MRERWREGERIERTIDRERGIEGKGEREREVREGKKEGGREGGRERKLEDGEMM